MRRNPMSAKFNAKLKLLYLMKIFNKQSDSSHMLTVQDLINKLKEYEIDAERKSIYNDIELLRSFGMDILVEKSVANRYYLASREFELVELKLLMDAVLSSKFITAKKSEELIDKIQTLASAHEALTLKRKLFVKDRIKTMNESIYYHVDKLHKAIQTNRLIEFKYTDYTLDKRLSFRRDGEIYTVSPYALSWADDHYYLIAYHERYGALSHFRVDRMADLEITKHKIPDRPEYSEFNNVKYSKTMFQMFGGSSEQVELEFHASLINAVIDRFGREVEITTHAEQSFRITVEVAMSPTFLAWLFMFGNKVKIISPDSLIAQMRDAVKQVSELYKE
jgi:predicted DNA-binding transcriptional regulator YafY